MDNARQLLLELARKLQTSAKSNGTLKGDTPFGGIFLDTSSRSLWSRILDEINTSSVAEKEKGWVIIE